MAGHLMLVNPRKRKRRYVKRNPLKPEVKARRAASRKRKSARRAAVRGAVKRTRSFFRSAGRRAGKAARGAVKATRRGLRRRNRSKRKPQSIKALLTNPGSFIRSTVMPAAIGSVGALALDMAYAYVPIPANIKNGALAPVVKTGVVGLLGAAAVHFTPNAKAASMVNTAVTASIIVIWYSWLKGRVQSALPNVRLGEFLDDETGCPIPGVTPLAYWQAGEFFPGDGGDDIDGMGEYVSEYVSGGEIDSDDYAGGDWNYGGYSYGP